MWLLSLRATKVTDAGLADVGRCKTFEHLDLSGTSVTDGGPAHLMNPRLIGFGLAGVATVKDAGLGALKDLRGPRIIGLDRTGVMDAGPARLAESPWLETVNVTGSKVTAKGQADFRAAVPGCWVEHESGEVKAADVIRLAAQWVFSLGGSVRIKGQARRPIRIATTRGSQSSATAARPGIDRFAQ